MSIIKADIPVDSFERDNGVGLALIHSFIQQKITKQLLYLRDYVRCCKHKDGPSKYSFHPKGEDM